MSTPDGAVDLSVTVLGLTRDGAARPLVWESGPPPRLDGLMIGAPRLTRPPPHGGERHPDGDEILFLVSGRITVILEDADPPRHVELTPGDGFVVPRDVWHRVLVHEPSQLVHVTPGPGGEHRPIDS